MKFTDVLKEQILIMDGAMGTMVQELELSDSAFGGSLFKMLTDLLTFSRPEDLEGIHFKYLEAGANIIETNTFGASPLRLTEFDFPKIDTSDMQGLPSELDLKQKDLPAITRHLNIKACEIARKAIDRYKASSEYDGRPLFIAGSIGPSNNVISSTRADLQKTTFDKVVENNFLQVMGLLEGGADILLFETQQDILELKASIIGAKKAFVESGKTLPIMAQVTVDTFAKMQIFNTDIHAAYVAVEGMGIATFGVNCNVGPVELKDAVKKLSKISHHPISIVPNAGQPTSEDGKTCYKLTPEEMAETMEPFVRESGVSIVGGCCGTRPDHIRAMREKLNGVVPASRETLKGVYISGPQEAVLIDSSENLVRIGEKINLRGSKKIREAVENESGIQIETLEEAVIEQVKGLGIDIIDICMDSNIVDTQEIFPKVIHDLTSDFSGAMCLDSFSVEALDNGIKSYPGRPIINSFSLEEYEKGVSKLDATLSLTKDHHPVYIALVNGPEGPGITADEKYELAVEIVKQAGEKHGVTPDQILIDVNAYPIGAESIDGLNFCAETFEALPRIKSIHPDIKTTIGVGNLTAGLGKKPYMRKVLTSVFLHEARKKGLDCAIMNPDHYVPMESLDEKDVELGRRVIIDHDMGAFEELEAVALTKKTGVVEKKADYSDLGLEASICQKIKDGFKQKADGTVEKDGESYFYKDAIVEQAVEAIKKYDPLDFISNYLMTAMRELGDGFGRGEVSLPHLLKSADVMRHVMGYLEWHMQVQSGIKPGEAIAYKGVVVIGTVYQDVHSIGKDLAKTLLENYGYRVIDLGVQVPLEKFIETARQEKADAIGMSALLVQTSNHMITVANMLKTQAYAIPVLIGGAPVNDRHAAYVAMHGQDDQKEILGSVFYCQSGMDGVNAMSSIMDKDNWEDICNKNKEKLALQYRKAKGLEESREKLFASLKRRKVSLKKHNVASTGYGIHKVEFRLGNLDSNIDTKSLYSLNWKYGKKSSWGKKGIKLEELEKLKSHWIEQAGENQWITPRAKLALLPAQAEGDDLIIYSPDQQGKIIGRINFTVCIGKGQKDKFSVAQYFHSKSSGIMDCVGLQITTAGTELEKAVTRFKDGGDSESALFLQGLGDRVAEDLAEYIHQLLRKRSDLKKEQSGQRYSPGYPAVEDLIGNKVIFDILGAQDLGISLTGSNEFDPASTTAAIICFHKDAGYS